MYMYIICFAEYGTYRSAKTVYCINCILFFVRVLSFYTASSYLGPKLVMIARMVQNIFRFVISASNKYSVGSVGLDA